MKVVQIASVHPRYDTRVFIKDCRSLAASGHDVTLIVADGQGDGELDGVCIVDAGKLNGRLNRMLHTVKRVYRMAASLSGDIHHLHDPALLRIASRPYKVGGRTRVVFDSHEDVPRQIMAKHWVPTPLRGPVSWAVERVENHIARRLSGIVAATPHIAERFCAINAHSVAINNYPIPAELAAGADAYTRKRQVYYLGGITRVRGVEALIRALPLVPEAALVLCGGFQELGLEAEARELPGWRQLEYLGAWRARLPRATRELVKLDVVIGESVYPFAVVAGAVLARRHRAPVPFEVRDLWPQTLLDLGRLYEKSLTSYLRRLEKWLYRRAERIFSLLPKSVDYLFHWASVLIRWYGFRMAQAPGLRRSRWRCDAGAKIKWEY